MTAKQVTAVLLWRWIGNKPCLPNYTGRGSGGESDLFLLTDAGYCEEIEIKVSLADFRREFTSKRWKHDVFTGKYECGKRLIPRRFWFAAPADLAALVAKELSGPPYGLLSVSQEGVTELIPATPIAGARKLEPCEFIGLARCMTYRLRRLYPEIPA